MCVYSLHLLTDAHLCLLRRLLADVLVAVVNHLLHLPPARLLGSCVRRLPSHTCIMLWVSQSFGC